MHIGDRIECNDTTGPLGLQAIIAALILHGFLLASLSIVRDPLVPLPEFRALSVTLVPPTVKEEPQSTLTNPAPAEPIDTPKAVAIPEVKPPAVAPVAETAPVTETPSELITAREAKDGELSAAPSLSPEAGGGDYIGSLWALKPPLATDRLEGLGLGEAVDCLQSLSEDCNDMRKEVFAEYQMTDTDKVWTQARADTGMPSQFYGLSEREIRLKVGSKIAGENGFMILPGIGIDGQFWDMLHGVKKGCEMKRGVTPDGTYDVVRVCPDSLPAARDRKYHIPKAE
ncbi:hypothetical protein [Fretibacter rubidus]|uniref:hypothetical protein n=1 Tax=Fretibacter rubidus TaxID=570162 RepID=UPI00352A244E